MLGFAREMACAANREETMSDSAEGDVPRTGADANLSDPAQATIEPDAAEQFASAFVPVWRFEDAPFSAGARLSADDIQDLGNGGTATSTRVGLKSESRLEAPPPVAARDVVPKAGASEGRVTDPFPPPVLAETISVKPSPTVPNVRSSEDGNEEAGATGSRVAVSVVARVDGLDDSAVLRSLPRRRLLLGLGAGIVATVAVLGILLTRTEAPATPAALATLPSPPRAEDIPIIPLPPPPPADTTPTTTAPSSPPSEAPPPRNVAAEAPSGLPPASRPTSAPTHAEEPARPPRTPPKSAAKPAGGTIIRDNPF
jgi:hypothetical protein